jgi:hypothetical protein
VEGDRDQEVERHFAFVPRVQHPALAVHAAGVELGHQIDPLVREQMRQRLRCHRLGERAVERCDVRELDAVSHAALREVPVGEERELQGRGRTLDRHLDHVHHEASTLESRQCVA